MTPPTPPRPLTPGPARPGAPAAPGPASSGLNVAIDPIKVVRRRLWLFVLAAVAGVGLGVATHLILARLAPRYTAVATFEYTSTIRSADDVSDTGNTDEIERFMNTQAFVMTQDNVLQEALQDPRIRQDTDWVKPFIVNGNLNLNKALLELKEIVTARPRPDSAIVELRVTTKNPRDAANIANAIQSAYYRQQRQKAQTFATDAVEAMSKQLDTTQTERRQLEARMARLMADNNIESWDERLDSITVRLQGLTDKRVNLQENIAIMQEQLKQYEEQLNAPGGATYPQAVHDEVDADPVIVKLRQDIADLETSLKSALRRYGDNHRIVKRIRHDIQARNDQLNAERSRLLDERFLQQVEETRANLRSLQQAEQDMTATIDKAQQRKQEISQLREEYFTMKADAERLAAQEEELKSKIADERARNERDASTRIISVATAPTPRERSFPKIQIVVPLVTLLTVGVVAGVVFLREILEQRIREPADLKLLPKAKLLGVVPDVAEDPEAPKRFALAALDAPAGAVAESIRQLRAAIVKRCEQQNARTILFIPGMPGSGATSVLTNLAVSLALAERRTLIIDANFRKPAVHTIFEISPSPGLGEAMLNELPLEDVVRSTSVANLDVLPAGAASLRVSERLTTSAVDRVLNQARELYDVVLLDVAPAMISSDAFALASRCDAAALVVRAMGEKRGLIARVLHQLEDMRATCVGVVVNRVAAAAGGYLRQNIQALHTYHEEGQAALASEVDDASSLASVNGEAAARVSANGESIPPKGRAKRRLRLRRKAKRRSTPSSEADSESDTPPT